MDLLSTLLSAQGGQAVKLLADRFGIDEGQASSAVAALLPALAGGLQNNVSQEGGMEALLNALGGGSHEKYLDDPGAVAHEDTIVEGNGILSHLLGSKDVSRQVAADAAEQTGVDHSIMKQMLPVVATMVMGALSKQTSNTQSAAPQDNILGMLSGVLGGQSGGDTAGAVIGLVSKFFQR